MFISNTYWILKAQPSNLDGTFFYFHLPQFSQFYYLQQNKQTKKKSSQDAAP